MLASAIVASGDSQNSLKVRKSKFRQLAIHSEDAPKKIEPFIFGFELNCSIVVVRSSGKFLQLSEGKSAINVMRCLLWLALNVCSSTDAFGFSFRRWTSDSCSRGSAQSGASSRAR